MRIGIFGAGQLGRMLALAGIPLGFRFRFLDPAEESPARELGEFVHGDFTDPAKVDQFMQGLDLVTIEFENIPVTALRLAAAKAAVRPGEAVLATGQHRVLEKRCFNQLGIPTPRFAAAASAGELKSALLEIGAPAVVKTCTLGYDGKGQAVVRDVYDHEEIWRRLGQRELIVEQMIPFSRELSILGVRSSTGEVRCYPLVENRHQDGILARTIAPAPDCAHLAAAAESYMRSLLTHFQYVGVLALELFEHQGKLLANEMAPRVHNSGHWSMDGAHCSQFENHIRAITGLPLGSTAVRQPTVMHNFIGSLPDAGAVLAHPQFHLHLYGKSPRPGRKLGHLNVCTSDPELLAEAERLAVRK